MEFLQTPAVFIWAVAVLCSLSILLTDRIKIAKRIQKIITTLADLALIALWLTDNVDFLPALTAAALIVAVTSLLVTVIAYSERNGGIAKREAAQSLTGIGLALVSSYLLPGALSAISI